MLKKAKCIYGVAVEKVRKSPSATVHTGRHLLLLVPLLLKKPELFICAAANRLKHLPFATVLIRSSKVKAADLNNLLVIQVSFFTLENPLIFPPPR